MSEARKIDPLEVFERAAASMKAFGYVDRGWVETAFLAFLDRQEKKKEKTRKRPGLWARAGNFLASFIPGLVPADKPPSERAMMGRDPAPLKLLKLVLAHVPEAKKNAARGPRHGARRPLDQIVANADKDDLALVAKFLRESGLEETGFPVREIGEPAAGARDGDGARSARAGEEKSVLAQRAALSMLTGGLLYRFAYDREGPLKWEDAPRVFRSEGVFRVYVCPPEQAYVEQRLLLFGLEKGGSIVRAAEIRKRSSGFALRGGYVVPASGVNTVILSSDFSAEKTSELVEAWLGEAEREMLLPIEAGPMPAASSFLQEHQLGFYTLINRGGGEMRGSVLDGPAPGGVVGYRLDQGALGPVADAGLGLMTAEQIERLDPRDRVLIASTAHQPSVSIELG